METDACGRVKGSHTSAQGIRLSLAEKPRPQSLSSGSTGAQGSVLTRHVWVSEADLPEVWACRMCELAGHFPWVSFMGRNGAEPRGGLVPGSSLGSGARPLRGGGQQPETGRGSPQHTAVCEAKPRSFEEKKASRPRVGRVLTADVESTNQKRKDRRSVTLRFRVSVHRKAPYHGQGEGPHRGSPEPSESVWGPGRCLRLGSNSPPCTLLTPPGQCPQFILQLPGPGPPTLMSSTACGWRHF